MNTSSRHLSFSVRSTLMAACSIAGLASFAAPAAAAGPKATLDAPTILVVGATAKTISVQVCGGAKTGAPAGFSLQWLEAADFTGAWPSDGSMCKASFSGNASTSRFPLKPGQCTVVEIGNLFDDEAGVSFTCSDDLLCATQYVFRGFAHATNTAQRSPFTANLFGSTSDCVADQGCTYTQGYWKNHPDEWPVVGLTLGTGWYDNATLIQIFWTPARGNGLLALAHQLIAAKLNLADGASGTDASQAIAEADALIGDLLVGGGGFLAPTVTSALTTTLASYNEGATGPGHCEDPIVSTSMELSISL